jgi:hypothetical protein
MPAYKVYINKISTITMRYVKIWQKISSKAIKQSTARHKDAQRGRASRQPAIYNYKSEVMLMMT